MQLTKCSCTVSITWIIVNCCCLCRQVSKTVVDMQIEMNRLREEIEASKFEMTNEILQMEISLAETEEEKKRLVHVAAAAKEKLEVAERSQKEMAEELAQLKTNNTSLAAAHQKEVNISTILSICFTFCQDYNREKCVSYTVSFQEISVSFAFLAHTHARMPHARCTRNCFTALCPGLPRWAGTRRNIHPLTPILVINHHLSSSSIYYNPWHFLCSIYVPDSLFPLSPSFLWSTSWPGTLHFILHTFLHSIIVFFMWHMPPSQPVLLSNYYLSLSRPFTWNSVLKIDATHPSDHFHLCPLKCHLIFLS